MVMPFTFFKMSFRYSVTLAKVATYRNDFISSLAPDTIIHVINFFYWTLIL